MKFTKLRLSGFKSFVEPVEFAIEPGLTGIVGPNGCGKSNLLEAVRWVMGESSYKSMRGTGMEDVIFAGTAGRPPHNLAEVSLILDNKTRRAPSGFNDTDTIEISRRIEREVGSVYRINGQDVRARDVQLFFADAATGAHSPALVRQGQINEIISVKPFERRRILEEAAGISGLYSRRHEAELKLRAAQTNLSRLEDSTAHLASRVRSLRRQARQAVRYRAISEEIHRMHALMLTLRWQAAQEDVTEKTAGCSSAQHATLRLTTRAAQAARQEAESATQIPTLREEEARTAAALHRLRAALENLDKEETRCREAIESCEAQAKQMRDDESHAHTLLQDTQKTIAKLSQEHQSLVDDSVQQTQEEAEKNVKLSQERLERCENTLERLARERAAYEVRLGRLEEGLREAHDKREQARQELAALEQTRQTLKATQGIDSQKSALESLEQKLSENARAVTEIAARVQSARAAEEQAQGPRESARQVLEHLKAEEEALREFLGPEEEEPALAHHVHVEAGFEKALGAALGDDLLAALREVSDRPYWYELGPLSSEVPLPDGVRPLSEVVRGPSFLERRLSATGIVAQAQGAALQEALHPGQRLVSCEGDLWRWDGYRASAQGSEVAARRLTYQNRLCVLREERQRAQADHEAASRSYEAARAALARVQEEDQDARHSWSRAEEDTRAARAAFGAAQAAAEETKAQLARLEEGRQRVLEMCASVERACTEKARALESLRQEAPSQEGVATAREEVVQARRAFSEAQAAARLLAQEQALHATRRQSLATDREAWETHARNTQVQVSTLKTRQAEGIEQRKVLSERLLDIGRQRQTLLDRVQAADKACFAATEALREAEKHQAAHAKAARAAEAELAQAREEQARQETALEGAQARCVEAENAIEEAFHCTPDECRRLVGEQTQALFDLQKAQQELERLTHERESLGAVNLAAEQDAREAQAELEAQTTEQKDLLRAINRLRHGIRQLNKEGRTRLLTAFEAVNGHFETLFTRLFGGGKAHLKLVESEDPLEAGLEIMVRPPGKRLQSLSLLSGGEQTLSAIALMFAVFLTNPAPICILDEVDAALDDANVERFCDLLQDMSTSRQTRFVIITHHALTMARMQRLFGVTMPERGVSQIVSVDLQTASQYAESGLSAAQ